MLSRVESGARRHLSILALACLAAGALGGCAANTQLVDMWRDPTAVRRPIHRMLVVAIRRDETSRRIWEDGFVAALNKEGVDATPAALPIVIVFVISGSVSLASMHRVS